MKKSIAILASVMLALPAFADDQLRDVQALLKTEGFYYGEADGKDTPESAAAIRRYQIRNGLKVTGKLDDETLAALGVGEVPENPKAAKPAETAPPRTTKPPVQFNPPAPNTPAAPKRNDLLRNKPAMDDEVPGLRPRRPSDADEEAEPAQPRTRRSYPDDPAVVEPPTPVPGATYDDFATFYHGTPYANAPREIQLDIARKAQAQLVRRGLYREQPDGRPGASTADALFAYQEQRHITRTGRLDLQTLVEMNLLPGRGPDAPPLRPFRDPNRGGARDRGVDYRGLIR